MLPLEQQQAWGLVSPPLSSFIEAIRLGRRNPRAPGLIAGEDGSVTSDDDGGSAVQVFNVLRGEASQIRSTPFGNVGTVFSGQGIDFR
jgi:hypothetical protein